MIGTTWSQQQVIWKILENNCPRSNYEWGTFHLITRAAGIVVPFISNDASPSGHNAPGTGKGEADIYEYNNYLLVLTVPSLYLAKW